MDASRRHWKDTHARWLGSEQIRAILGWRVESQCVRPRRRILRDLGQCDVALSAGPLCRHAGICIARSGYRNVEIWPTLRRMVHSDIPLMDLFLSFLTSLAGKPVEMLRAVSGFLNSKSSKWVPL